MLYFTNLREYSWQNSSIVTTHKPSGSILQCYFFYKKEKDNKNKKVLTLIELSNKDLFIREISL